MRKDTPQQVLREGGIRVESESGRPPAGNTRGLTFARRLLELEQKAAGLSNMYEVRIASLEKHQKTLADQVRHLTYLTVFLGTCEDLGSDFMSPPSRDKSRVETTSTEGVTSTEGITKTMEGIVC